MTQLSHGTSDSIAPKLPVCEPYAGTTTISAPKVRKQPKTDLLDATDAGWKVVLHDDDVTPIELVVYGLQRAAGLSLEVAEAVANEANNEQVAIVKRGLTEEDAQIICGGLRRWTRIEGLCPGVICEALRDED